MWVVRYSFSNDLSWNAIDKTGDLSSNTDQTRHFSQWIFKFFLPLAAAVLNDDKITTKYNENSLDQYLEWVEIETLIVHLRDVKQRASTYYRRTTSFNLWVEKIWDVSIVFFLIQRASMSNIVQQRTPGSQEIPLAVLKLQLICRKQNSIVIRFDSFSFAQHRSMSYF